MSRRSWPFRLKSAAGLRLELNANGALRRIDHEDVVLDQNDRRRLAGQRSERRLDAQSFGHRAGLPMHQGSGHARTPSAEEHAHSC